MTELALKEVTDSTEIMQIDDLDTFVRIMIGWHSKNAKTAAHFKTIPPGTEVYIDGEGLVLDGDALKGFQLGVSMCLELLGELPFAVELDDAPAVH